MECQTVSAGVDTSSLWHERRDLPPVIQRVRPYTMVPRSALVDLARQVRVVVEQSIPGALVECGAWRGGASFLMAEVLRQAGVSDRQVWMFDSFEGINPPQDVDGPAALAWAQNKKGPMYFDNLRAPLEDVERAAASLGLTQLVRPVKGWFDQTLPATREQIGPIALLRIDADWHSSVKCCLDNLYDQVVEGGFVVFDDYYTWDGCAVAVHEFLGQRRLAHRVETVGGIEPACAVFRKGGTTWAWLRELHLVAQELTELGAGRTILVDDESLRSRLPGHLATVPFLERDGVYHGAPPDDQTAVAELERMRSAGSARIAFAWPSFWWLEHYRGFVEYLRARFSIAHQSDRLLVFDLRGETSPSSINS